MVRFGMALWIIYILGQIIIVVEYSYFGAVLQYMPAGLGIKWCQYHNHLSVVIISITASRIAIL